MKKPDRLFFRRMAICITGLALLLYSGTATAQVVPAADTTALSGKNASALDLLSSMDAFDVVNLLLRRNLVRQEGKAARFSFIPGLGWAPQNGWTASVSAVLAFEKRQAPPGQKTSNIIAGFTYTQRDQVIAPFHVILWTRGNRLNLALHGRYMRFPSKTYGLGADTRKEDGCTVNYDYLKLHPTVLWRLRPNLYAGPVYFFDYLQHVREEDLAPGRVTDYQRYGLERSNVSSGLGLRVLFDSRRNIIKPVNGWFASATLRVNREALGSTNNWNSLVVEARHYLPLPRTSRNVLAFWSYNWFTPGAGKPPYLLLPSNSWDDWHNTGRGYVQGRYRGRNMIYFETEYRVELLRNGLLGGVAFANMQAYPDKPLRGLGRVLPGIGAGLRIKLDKFSGTNMALDYGIGANGSGAISMNLGEVF
ncbi:MAG: hypothetical protein EOO16_03005 [Chitinophagaceae bacterium]|nr:MAG: hypothetical protein EOO16_03005 [Chitinophagaceae bacterium]